MIHECGADVVLLGTEWQPRALLRAQLTEDGFEVVAADSGRCCGGPSAQVRRRGSSSSRRGLPDPEQVLEGLKELMKPERVLVLTAIGTVPIAKIRIQA